MKCKFTTNENVNEIQPSFLTVITNGKTINMRLRITSNKFNSKHEIYDLFPMFEIYYYINM